MSSTLQGALQHHGRFAFLLAEEGRTEDLMIRGPSLRLAMDGDRVEARVVSGRGRPCGEIVRVLERARSTALGRLSREGGRWVLRPEGDGQEPFEVLSFAPGVRPQPEALAVVRVTRWPEARARAGGELSEVLGDPRSAGVRATAALRSRELPESFPPDVLEESRRLPDRVEPPLWRGRLELFRSSVFTIDGADAKDFDDAVSIEELSGGRLRLGVHVADVSHYVQPGTALDREARRRATSVYLPDRVVPMLPPKLSDDLCSLRPDLPRLTLSCLLDLEADGRLGSARFAESAIRSCRRFTYEEAQDLLDGKAVPRVPAGAAAALRRMGPLAKALHRARILRGSLDFDFPEYKVMVDGRGAPLRVERRPRLDSHRLIEEFMLAANEACARALLAAGAPFLSRVHELPDPAKLEALAAELGRLGIRVPPGLASEPAAGIQDLLRKARGHPLEETVHALTVRSLRQAVYQGTHGAHFGLASSAYAHFTSPIRRYPDLFNHRAVRALVSASGRPRWDHAADVSVGKLASHCSARERLAAEAERESTAVLRGQLLSKRIGQTFEGLASRQAQFGVFVLLPETGAVGLARGATAPLGSRVTVRLKSVDPASGELELSLAPAGPRPPAARPPSEGRPSRERGRRGRRRS